jgi:4-aminobutyrate aminotransferase/(S)-3-amino-2-methylpropionate transaminase
VVKPFLRVKTPYREITTSVPAPGSLPILERMKRYEPRSMEGLPPVVWDRAEGFQVYDAFGNKWLDWTAGVLVANVGHSHPKIIEAIVEQAQHGLLFNYIFPSEIRVRLAQRLIKLAPPPLEKVFLLNTGAEAIENAIKLSRAWGQKIGGHRKIVIVSYEGAFHGRTLGAQMAGGIRSLKSWIGTDTPGFVQVPFPDRFICQDVRFQIFEASLRQQGVNPEEVCAVMIESYHGRLVSFTPFEYMKDLRRWCDQHRALLIFDEVQASFGRTGKWFAFQHYNVRADLVCCGKGISSSLPLSAVFGRAEVMDIFEPGSMSSTHSGNPICVAATLANIDVLEDENLIERAASLEPIFFTALNQVANEHKDIIGIVDGKGLLGGMRIIFPGTKQPNPEMARKIVNAAIERGLLILNPVYPATLKFHPPLCITEDAIKDGAFALNEAIIKAKQWK